jgi:hypothetical protein
MKTTRSQDACQDLGADLTRSMRVVAVAKKLDPLLAELPEAQQVQYRFRPGSPRGVLWN